MNKKTKFWFFFFLGLCAYIPCFIVLIIVQMYVGTIVFFGVFLIQCYFLYRFVYKGVEPKYPMVPPEGRMDSYSPRTNIPRPIHEDVRRYPRFFKRKKMKRWEKRRKAIKKS